MSLLLIISSLMLICNNHKQWFLFVLWLCTTSYWLTQLCGSEIPSNSSLLGRSLAKLGEVMYVLESQQNGLLKREVKELLFSQLSFAVLCFKESGSFLQE